LRQWLNSTSPSLARVIVTLAMFGWAVPSGAAHLSHVHRTTNSAVFLTSTSSGHRPAGPQRSARQSVYTVPRAVYFREVAGRGLLADVWINGTGPYTFAIDTGAGATIVSSRVAGAAGVNGSSGRSHRIVGLSGVINARTASEIKVRSLAIGDRDNLLPATGALLTADIFPSGIDGVLDPTESYSPLGYVIDFPRSSLSAFDPAQDPLRSNSPPVDGTVVSWVSDAGSRRPYVLLDDGRKALLDTGSEFGLALRDNSRSGYDLESSSNRSVRDLGGGALSARRVAPLTVAVGALALQRIPTDLVSGLSPTAPILLGRAALRPFRLSFDPLNRLIEIAPG
jgi:Aspartyl protease